MSWAASLERDGFLVLPALLDQSVLMRLQERLGLRVAERWAAVSADPTSMATWPEKGVVRFANSDLPADDDDLRLVADHPVVRDVNLELFGEPLVAGNLAVRAPMPGHGHQGLHPDRGDFVNARADGLPLTHDDMWPWVSIMWCITEFTLDNGPLRVVPGSHAASVPPVDPEGFGSGMGPHPDEVRIVAPAGSAILFTSGSIWHSGTFNYSPAPRIALTGMHTPLRLRNLRRSAASDGRARNETTHAASSKGQ